jgi:murein DD-endopeptidase MepM/ murein hydrolase activator NlpD
MRLTALIGKWMSIIVCCCAFGCASMSEETASASAVSQGIYQLPYADTTMIKVFDDFATHRPHGRIDFFAIEGQRPYRIVAAATGRVMAIQDGYGAQQTGRPAAECRNNYVWIAHANGEWTIYSHLAQGSVTELAKLKVGDVVKAGAFIGSEAAVGCAMLDHLHFEVAVPQRETPIDRGSFLLGDERSARARNPQFCNVPGGVVNKDSTYRATPC